LFWGHHVRGNNRVGVVDGRGNSVMCTTGTVSVVAVAPVMFTDLPNGRDVNGVVGKAHTSRV